MINKPVIKPEDFIKDYSNENKAELFINFIDESRYFHNAILNYGYSLLRKIYLKYLINPNDKEIEYISGLIKNRNGKISIEKVVRYLEDRFRDDHLRKFEYAYLARCLARKNIKKNIIVDMGGGFSYSTITSALLELPESQITSVDVIDFPRKSKFGIKYVTGNSMDTKLQSNYADVVSMISMLEHVGLGRYGDPIDINGDIKAMQEVYRVLKPGGYVVLTVPYGYPTVVYNLHRIYDRGRFNRITKGFKPIVLEYSYLGRKCRRKDIEKKHAVKNIKGFYNDVKNEEKIYCSQGGVLALLRKV
ncbi:MAG: DUF268 domain-containing protein [Bacteroidota bacterium]